MSAPASSLDPARESDAVDSETATTPSAAADTTLPRVTAQHGDSDSDVVTMLQAAFPAMDKTIITEVLAAHGGEPDSTSIALLEMSDPTRTEAGATATNPATHSEDTATANRQAQMQSDEAYARELMEQMEREHQEAYGRPLGTAPSEQLHQQRPVDYSNLNYIPRQRGGQAIAHNQQQQQYQGQGQYDGQRKDELEQLAEQFGKFADTGKKTLNTFLSKAKDKVAELQQQRAAQAQQDALQAPGPGSSSAYQAPSSQPTTIGGFTIPSIPAPWGASLANLTGKQRPTSPREQMRAEFPSNTKESVMRDYSSSGWDGSNLTSLPTPQARNNSFDDRSKSTHSSSSGTGSGTSTQPISLTAHPASRGLSTSPTPTPAPYSSSPSGGFRPGSASSPAKVQMLPRQPISLLDNSNGATASSTKDSAVATKGQAAPTGQASRRDADDDDDDSDVEYVRNPFNDDD